MFIGSVIRRPKSALRMLSMLNLRDGLEGSLSFCLVWRKKRSLGFGLWVDLGEASGEEVRVGRKRGLTKDGDVVGEDFASETSLL